MKSFGDVLNGRTRTGKGRFVLASFKGPKHEILGSGFRHFELFSAVGYSAKEF